MTIPTANNPTFTLVTDVNLADLRVVTKLRQSRSASELASFPTVRSAKRHAYSRTHTAWPIPKTVSSVLHDVSRADIFKRDRTHQIPTVNGDIERTVTFLDLDVDRVATSTPGTTETARRDTRSSSSQRRPPTTDRCEQRSSRAISFIQEGEIFVPSEKFSRRRERTRSPALGANRGFTLLKATKGILVNDAMPKPQHFNVNWLTPPQTAPAVNTQEKYVPSHNRSKRCYHQREKPTLSVTWSLPASTHSDVSSRNMGGRPRARPGNVGLRAYGPDMCVRWAVPEQPKPSFESDWMDKLAFVKKICN